VGKDSLFPIESSSEASTGYFLRGRFSPRDRKVFPLFLGQLRRRLPCFVADGYFPFLRDVDFFPPLFLSSEKLYDKLAPVEASLFPLQNFGDCKLYPVFTPPPPFWGDDAPSLVRHLKDVQFLGPFFCFPHSTIVLLPFPTSHRLGAVLFIIFYGRLASFPF